jgi:predicted acyltransferase
MAARIESVDILRGGTILGMILVNTPGTWSHVYAPLLHAQWHGLTLADLIFPFFLFIVGISIYFAYKTKAPSVSTYKKIIIRSAKLIGLGLFLNLFLPYFPFVEALDTVRIPGVLQRIGLVFLCTSVLYLNCSWKVLVGVIIVLLLGYWLFMGFMPFQDGTLPTFDRAPNNWANYIDVNSLGKHTWQADYDPEGLLSTLPSIATCLIGVLIGRLLDHLKHIKELFLAAVILLVLGAIIGIWFPINKSIWSSSFALFTSGCATLILACIYYLKDIKQLKFGTIFKYVGVNGITIYFLSSIISKSMYLTKIGDDNNVHSYIYEHLFVQHFVSNEQSSLLYALAVVLFYLGLGYLLYKKKIVIKV